MSLRSFPFRITKNPFSPSLICRSSYLQSFPNTQVNRSWFFLSRRVASTSGWTRYLDEPQHFPDLSMEEAILIIRNVQDRILPSVKRKIEESIRRPLPDDMNETIDILLSTLSDPKVLEKWENEGFFGHKEAAVQDFVHSLTHVKDSISKMQTSTKVPSWDDVYQFVEKDPSLTKFFKEVEVGRDPQEIARKVLDTEFSAEIERGDKLNQEQNFTRVKPIRLFGDIVPEDFEKHPERQDLGQLLKTIQTPKGQLYYERVKKMKMGGDGGEHTPWMMEAARPETKHQFKSELFDLQFDRTIQIPWAFITTRGKTIPVGTGYDVSYEDRVLHFSEGAGGIFDSRWDQNEYKKGYFLLRMVDFEVINEIKQKSLNGFTTTAHLPYMIIGGKAGSGKSGCISQTVLWARKNGFIVFWVPNAYEYVNTGYLEKSKIMPGCFDQPVVAIKALRTLIGAHKKQLKTLPLRSSFQFGPFSAPTTQYNLFDLLHYASENEKLATEALYHFRNEMNYIIEYPTMIAIDGLNCMWEPSSWLDPGDVLTTMTPRYLSGEKLTLSAMIRDYKHHGLINGTYVGALTTASPQYKKGFMKLFGYADVTHVVPRPSASEAHTIFNALANRGCFDTLVGGGNIATLHTVSQGNMHEIWMKLDENLG